MNKKYKPANTRARSPPNGPEFWRYVQITSKLVVIFGKNDDFSTRMSAGLAQEKQKENWQNFKKKDSFTTV